MIRRVPTSSIAAGALLALALLRPTAADGGQVWACDLKEDSYALMPAFAGNPFPSPPHGPVIRVVSVDGKQYHHVEPNVSLDFHVWAKSACSPNSLDTQVKLKIGNYEETLVSGWGGSLFTGLIDGKDLEFKTPYQQPAMPGGPVAACNNFLATHYPSPDKAWEPLQKGFAIRIDNAFQARLHVTCGALVKNSANKTINVPAWIHCKGTPLAQPPPPPPSANAAGAFKAQPGPRIPKGPNVLAQPFAVTGVTAKVQPSQVTATHQAQLTTTAEISTNVTGSKVDYRWNVNGAPGPVASLQFTNSTTRTVSTPLMIDCKQQAGLTEAAATKGGGSIGQLAGAPPNVKNGYVRLEIVSPKGGIMKSNDAAYSVTCKPESPPPPTPIGTVAATPTKPPPPRAGKLAAAPVKLPDLQISGAEVPRGQPQHVKVQVLNNGPGPAPATRVRLWTAPKGKQWFAVVPALAPGKSAEVLVKADAAVLGAKSVYLRVNDPKKFEETNLGNNGYQLK